MPDAGHRGQPDHAARRARIRHAADQLAPRGLRPLSRARGHALRRAAGVVPLASRRPTSRSRRSTRRRPRCPPGAEGLRLLPYLQGERTPVWDAGARGAFVGLSLVHGRGHLYRAVLEGVAVSFRHCAEIAAEKGLRLREVIAVNGGARSAVWRQILCDALGVPAALRARRRGRPGRRRAAGRHGGRPGGRGGDRARAGAARWCDTSPTRPAPRPTRACSRRGASSTRRSARSPDGAHRHPRGRLHGRGPHGAGDRQRPHRGALGHAPGRPPDRGGARGSQASQARARAARGA